MRQTRGDGAATTEEYKYMLCQPETGTSSQGHAVSQGDEELIFISVTQTETIKLYET